jgi:hypothetical protein
MRVKGHQSQMRLLAACMLAACVIPFAGCSDSGSMVKVRGTVKCAGQPVQHGSIMFIPEAGPASSGQIENGQYTLQTRSDEGVRPGSYRVVILSYTPAPTDPNQSTPVKSGPEVPAKYNLPDKSDLKAEIESGKENVIDFDLK